MDTLQGFNTVEYEANGYQPTGVLLDLMIKHKDAHRTILERALLVAEGLHVDFMRLKSLFPSPGTSSQLPEELQEKRH
jgi:hypothetical protein